MGTTNGPTVETSGSIVLAPQPGDVGLGPKAAPARPTTPERTGSGKIFC